MEENINAYLHRDPLEIPLVADHRLAAMYELQGVLMNGN
jgi:hypothetical protein